MEFRHLGHSEGEADLHGLLPVLFQLAFLTECGNPVEVRLVVGEIEVFLTDRAEVAGSQVRDGPELVELSGGELRLEHALEEEALALVVEVAELELEREAAHRRRIEVLREVRRGDHDAVEVLHLLQEFVDHRHLPVPGRTVAVLKKSVDLIEEQDRVLRFRSAERIGDILFILADPLREDVAPLHHDHLAVKLAAEILDELGLARAGRPEEEDVEARTVRGIIVEPRGEVVARGTDDAVESDLAPDVESIKRIVLRGEEPGGRLDAHQLAVGFHEVRDEFIDLPRLGLHALHIRKHGRDPARARLVLRGVRFDLRVVDRIADLELADEIAPDRGALGRVKALEADRVVEAATNGLVHLVCRRVGDPDRRDRDLVENGVHYSLLRRLAASERQPEDAETAGIAAEEFVRLVNDHERLRGILLSVADLDSGHARGGRLGASVLVALKDLERGASGLPGKRTGEAGLARTGSPVEEDVALAAGGEHLLEDLAVMRGELAVVAPRKRILRVERPIEATLERLVVDTVHETGKAAAEVEVAVKQAEPEQRALRGKRLRDFAVRTVERHRVIERLVPGLDADRPTETRAVTDIGNGEHVGFDVRQLERALERLEATGDRLVIALALAFENVLRSRLQDFAADVARSVRIPERLEHAGDRIVQIEAFTVGTASGAIRIENVLGVGRLDQLDGLIVFESVFQDVEEVVIPDHAPVVLHHVAPEAEKPAEEIRLRNGFEFCHSV